MRQTSDNFGAEIRITKDGINVLSIPSFKGILERRRLVRLEPRDQGSHAPQWQTDVTDADIDAVFAPLPAQDEWTPL